MAIVLLLLRFLGRTGASARCVGPDPAAMCRHRSVTVAPVLAVALDKPHLKQEMTEGDLPRIALPCLDQHGAGGFNQLVVAHS